MCSNVGQASRAICHIHKICLFSLTSRAQTVFRFETHNEELGLLAVCGHFDTCIPVSGGAPVILSGQNDQKTRVEAVANALCTYLVLRLKCWRDTGFPSENARSTIFMTWQKLEHNLNWKKPHNLFRAALVRTPTRL